MAVPVLKKAQGNNISDTLGQSVRDTDTTMAVSTISKFSSSGGKLIIDRNSTAQEIVYATGVSGNNVIIDAAGRGLEGTTAVAHNSGAPIESVPTAGDWNDLITALGNVLVPSTGLLDTTKVVDLTTAQSLTNKTLSTGTNLLVGSDATGDMYYNGGSGVLTRLGIGSSGNILKVSGGVPTWSATSSGGTLQSTQYTTTLVNSTEAAGAFTDMLSVTFTPTATSNIVIMVAGTWFNTGTNSNVGQIVLDGVTISGTNNIGTDFATANKTQHFSANVYSASLNTSSHTVKMQFKESGGGTATVEGANMTILVYNA